MLMVPLLFAVISLTVAAPLVLLRLTRRLEQRSQVARAPSRPAG